MIFEDLGLKRLFDQGVPDAHLEAQEHKGGPLRWSFLEVKWSNKISVFFFPAKTRNSCVRKNPCYAYISGVFP